MSVKRTTSMISGNPLKLILQFAVPMLIGNIFQQMYNFADSAIVGRYLGGDALAAVGATAQINGFLISLAMGLTNGAGIIIAQCFGAQKYNQLKKSITAMIAVLTVITIAITAAGIIFAVPVLRLLNVPQEILGDSAAYMRIIFVGCFAVIIYNGCAAIMRNLGDSKTPLYMLIISSLLNVGLDLLFVIVFNMGVAGAAAATIIAQLVSAALCVMYLSKFKEQLHIDGLPRRAEKNMIKAIIRTGLPAAMQSSFISLGGMCVQGLINSFGTNAMAAYTASTKIDSITIQIIISIAISLSVFSGQNMGAGNIKRIHEGLRQTLSVMVPVCIVLAILLLIFKRSVISLLLDPASDGAAIDIGCKYLSVIGIGYIIAGIMQSYQNLLRGTGDVNVCVAAGMTELSMRVIASYIFVNIWGLDGIWYAIPFSWGCGCIIPIVRYYSGKWKNKRLVH